MNVCIIPARGGSKRIPKKNIKNFHGQPIIAYSIKNAINSKLFDEVIVSTDDEEISQVAINFGASVPFMRPKELSDDFTPSGYATTHALNFLKQQGKNVDFVCTMYATTPFLQLKYLQLAYEKLKDSDACSAFSCTSMPFPIQRTFKITQDERCEMFFKEYFSSRSQDLEPAYQDAGQFYWTNLKKTSSDIFFGKDSIPIILPRYLVQDIDTMEDWVRAEIMYEVIQRAGI
ncbi:pseudaminic acid cytidylyltransferase [Campylobacter sputorum]|uniref:pseudaminic acid cytidylyltransferase n=1 Tax=Campylobacter sputorum TaxID=206 RepID=UPI00053BEEA5|nr:pseudaminic acid cytidylyltransferase [Campylobacter sputorum]